VESENKRADEYWMGVRDALRMVDSFQKWAKRNKERAKDLDDFINEGLIAAAKRCESCLKDDLGLTFVEGEDHPLSESVPSGYEATPAVEPPEEVSLPPTDDGISIESVGRSDSEELEDISIEGPSREFASDFDLVEPSPLVVEATPSEPEPDEIPEDTPSFTWADYEEAVTPTKDDPVVEEVEKEAPSFDPEPVEEEELPIEEPVSLGPPKVLTPSEEPAIPAAEFESSIGEELASAEDDEEIEETDFPEPITEPPAPPPPPESEEDEDERRRRARRLFFGD
jgi:hypothetical protein